MVLVSLKVLRLHLLHEAPLDTALVLCLCLLLFDGSLLLLSLDLCSSTKFSLFFLLFGSIEFSPAPSRHLPALLCIHATLTLQIFFHPHFTFCTFFTHTSRSLLPFLNLLLASLFKSVLRQLLLVLVPHV